MGAEKRREWVIAGWKISLSHRPPTFQGRFGGGWNWKIGVQWSKRCVLLSLLIAQLRFDRPSADERRKLAEISRWAKRPRPSDSCSSGSTLVKDWYTRKL